MNLTTKLKEANLSQSRFALEIGLKQQTISKWCNKKSTPKRGKSERNNRLFKI